MPREQKIGLTLLILVIGLGGAFCFRRPPEGTAALPGLPGETGINEQVAELPTRPLLPGIDLQTPSASHAPTPDDLLTRELVGLQSRRSGATSGQQAPPPIGQLAESHTRTQQVPPPRDAPRDNSRPISTRPAQTPAAPQEKTHLVQPGETLSGIAYQYYGSASRYLDLYQANQDILASPNHLRPNMKLRIPAETGSVPPPQDLPATSEEIKEASTPAEPAVSQRSTATQSERLAPVKPTSQEKANTGTVTKTASQPIATPQPAQTETVPAKNARKEEETLAERKKKLFVPARHSPFHQPHLTPGPENIAGWPTPRQ